MGSVNNRRKISIACIALLSWALAAGCGGGANTPQSPVAITTQVVVTGLNVPLDLEQPNDGTGRLFVVEQGGTIRIIQGGSLLPQAFLNISSKIIFQDEMGLLGMAFHPNFPT